MASALLLSLLLLGSLAIGLAATDPEDTEDPEDPDDTAVHWFSRRQAADHREKRGPPRELQSKEDIMKFLSTVPLFSDLSDDQLSQIADIAELKYYQAGADIENEKPAGRGFETNTFVIYDGDVNVAQTSTHGRSAETTKLGPGDYLVQEVQDKTGGSTTYSVRALTDVKGLSLNMDALRQIVGDQFVLDGAA